MSQALGTILALARRLLKMVFGGSSWDAWMVLLAALFGLPLSDAELVLFTQLTGRTVAPSSVDIRIRESWFIIGRRAGKSMVAALIAVYLTTCRTYTLAPGERGVFMIIAAGRRQALVVKRYISGLLALAAPLRALVAGETKDAIELTNGLIIEIHTASFRTLRGYTVVGAVCDEIAFWPTDDSANPDAEILAALRPAMATVPEALLVCITSPYARRGEAWRAWKTHFGQDRSAVLVAKAPTAVMNPLVDPAVIAAAYEDDPARAAAEYGAEFRSDVQGLVTRDAAEAVVMTGRFELPPGPGEVAFVDVAGGGEGEHKDSAALAVARLEGETVLLCALREIRPPFSPAAMAEEFAHVLLRRGLSHVTGDRFAGEWPREQFQKHGVSYETTPLTKSDLYRELLPAINSRRVELLDEPRLLAQLLGLERRVGRSGKDSIDHGPSSHDDVINAAAGALVTALGVGAGAGRGMLQFAIEQLEGAKREDVVTVHGSQEPCPGCGGDVFVRRGIHDAAGEREFLECTTCSASTAIEDTENPWIVADPTFDKGRLAQ